MRVLLRGPVDPWTGYGRDLIGLTEALLDARVEVALWPLSVAPGLPDRVAALLSRPLDPPYDAVVWYAPPDNIQPWSMYGWGRVQLGWTMWERTPFHGHNIDWWDADSPDLQRGHVWSRRYLQRDTTAKGWLDALIVTCRMNVDAFAHVEQHLPIEVIPPGVDVDNYPKTIREPSGPFRFGWVGVPSARKALPTMLDAWCQFREQRPDVDAVLEVKTTGVGAGVIEAARTRDVVVHRDTWSTKQLAAWYGSLDALVSVSRGEGMNKPAVEAMATGTPVIAPRWGGHENWLYPDSGYPVAFEVGPSPIETDTVDCTVDAEDVARAMADVVDDPAARDRKGHAAANLVRSSMTWSRAANKLLQVAARHL